MQECRAEIAESAAIEGELAGEADGAALAREAPGQGRYVVGAAWALFAISIWAGWFVSTRFSVTTDLTAFDLVALRFGLSALVLLPVAIRMKGGIGAVRPFTALALFVGSGAFYSLLSTQGVSFAPPAEGAALTPGLMPLATALLGWFFLKEHIGGAQKAGFILILWGAIIIGGFGLFEGADKAWIGHILFVMGAFLFAGYTVALRGSGLTGLEATALVALWSSITYLPVYFYTLHPRIFELPPSSLLAPAFYQGVLTNVISLVAYGRAVAILGATRAAAFAALIPAVTTVLGVIILHEVPSLWDWPAIASVSIGVYLASGAPLPRRLARA